MDQNGTAYQGKFHGTRYISELNISPTNAAIVDLQNENEKLRQELAVAQRLLNNDFSHPALKRNATSSPDNPYSSGRDLGTIDPEGDKIASQYYADLHQSYQKSKLKNPLFPLTKPENGMIKASVIQLKNFHPSLQDVDEKVFLEVLISPKQFAPGEGSSLHYKGSRLAVDNGAYASDGFNSTLRAEWEKASQENGFTTALIPATDDMIKKFIAPNHAEINAKIRQKQGTPVDISSISAPKNIPEETVNAAPTKKKKWYNIDWLSASKPEQVSPEPEKIIDEAPQKSHYIALHILGASEEDAKKYIELLTAINEAKQNPLLQGFINNTPPAAPLIPK